MFRQSGGSGSLRANEWLYLRGDLSLVPLSHETLDVFLANSEKPRDRGIFE